MTSTFVLCTKSGYPLVSRLASSSRTVRILLARSGGLIQCSVLLMLSVVVRALSLKSFNRNYIKPQRCHYGAQNSAQVTSLTTAALKQGQYKRYNMFSLIFRASMLACTDALVQKHQVPLLSLPELFLLSAPCCSHQIMHAQIHRITINTSAECSSY
jgi:hypothetical protein